MYGVLCHTLPIWTIVSQSPHGPVRGEHVAGKGGPADDNAPGTRSDVRRLSSGQAGSGAQAGPTDALGHQSVGVRKNEREKDSLLSFITCCVVGYSSKSSCRISPPYGRAEFGRQVTVTRLVWLFNIALGFDGEGHFRNMRGTCRAYLFPCHCQHAWRHCV